MSVKAKKILFIENEPYLAISLGWGFAGWLGDNIIIEASKTCAEALSIVKEKAFDLVISKHRMPSMNGSELLKKIREVQPDIPAIMLSDIAPSKDTRELIDGYLIKPFELVKLLELISEVLSKDTGQESDYDASNSPSGAGVTSLVEKTNKFQIGSPPISNNLKENVAGRILIMDDDSSLRGIYRKVLTRAKYEVFEAGTVQLARNLLKLHAFDIFICDIHMGRDRSFDLLSEFGNTLTKNGTQVVMCSAYGQYRTKTQEMGADFFLEKPISLGTLLSLISSLMEQSLKKEHE